MIVEGIVSVRVMKYGRRDSEEEEEELHVAKRGKKRDCPFGVEMRSFLGVSEKVHFLRYDSVPSFSLDYNFNFDLNNSFSQTNKLLLSTSRGPLGT